MATNIVFPKHQQIATLTTIDMGGCNPEGECITVNNRYLERGGKPWLPAMGELQFSRYPRAYWEEALLKMKAAGIDIIASYVFWIHHEEIEGTWKWADNHDIRAFAELCAKHDLYFYPRIGPWVHGECRNGGLPDWIYGKCESVRSEDSAYLHYVDLLFEQIGKQLAGLYYKDGGPIVGIQLENEYGHVGGVGSEAHILTLKKLALRHGMDVPIYTVTGWGGAWVPEDGVLPVLGAYPAAPWTQHVNQLDLMHCFLFQSYFNDEEIGSDLSVMHIRETRFDPDKYPYFTCETGGGIQVTDHRRPYLTVADVSTVPFTQIGSGANLIGYYVFHGGTNPVGINSTFQESKETGYPNDLPELSYCFQAAVGEYGELHPSYRYLKLLHLFLRDFGEDMAPMPASLPDALPDGPGDMDTLRYAVRTKGGKGFVFISNYQRHAMTQTHHDVTLSVPTPGGTLQSPAFNVEAGIRALFPVNMDLGGFTLCYATAQPVCKVNVEDGTTYVFAVVPGIAPTFTLADEDAVTVEMPGKFGIEVFTREVTGQTVRVVLLPYDSTLNLWKGLCFGAEHLVISGADVRFDMGKLVLTSDDAQVTFGIYPAPEMTDLSSKGKRGWFSVFEMTQPEVPVAVTVSETMLENTYEITFPDGLPDDASDVFLDMDLVCDKAYLYAGDKVIADYFHFGRVWRVGLKRFPKAIFEQPLRLKMTPLRPAEEVYYEVRDTLPGDPTPQVKSIKARTSYVFTVTG